MKVRIKIGDFPDSVFVGAPKGGIISEDDHITLPEKIQISVDEQEAIAFGARLAVIHGKEKAEREYDSKYRRVDGKLDIIPAFTEMGGREIQRYWIAREGFISYKLAEEWIEAASAAYRRIIGYTIPAVTGVFRRYPQRIKFSVKVKLLDGEILRQGKILRMKAENGLIVKDAEVGTGFHWQHREDLLFMGILEARPGEKGVLLINEIDLEDYTASVNSSEMSNHCPPEYLKAQTIAARSAILATRGGHHLGEPFDLCNGDHCQCFYGAGRLSANSLSAAESTKGLILIHNNFVADTRYAKTCGGLRERYKYVWEDFNPGYLPAGWDNEGGANSFDGWKSYIDNSPVCHCNPEYYPYPDYHQDTAENFRWERLFTHEQAGKIIKERIGADLGKIQEIVPLQRGESGRIIKLAVIGDEKIVVNGELKIRRLLSDTHLPSSCFTIQKTAEGFKIKGAGWGHGVGMCQMGALAMAEMGFDHRKILNFYFPGTEITPIE
ncbi:SpoIID/LytB domain-containing protein [bacterium]|nr:SpoIID/LytB domain-containing protein [bacterium]